MIDQRAGWFGQTAGARRQDRIQRTDTSRTGHRHHRDEGETLVGIDGGIAHGVDEDPFDAGVVVVDALGSPVLARRAKLKRVAA